MLGVNARLGRTFLSDEDRPGHGRVAIIDDALWKGNIGGDAGIIGRKLDGTPYDIVGVLPPGFYFPSV
jgi:putative ABC transport system permease protein